MVTVLIISAKMADVDFIKKRYFKIKFMTLRLLSMTLPTKLYQVTQIIL